MKRLCVDCAKPLGRSGIRLEEKKAIWICSDCNHMRYESNESNYMGRYDIRFGNKYIVEVDTQGGYSELFEGYTVCSGSGEHHCFIFKGFINMMVPPDCTLAEFETYIAFQ